MVPMCVCLPEMLHATAAVKPPSGYSIVATTPNPNGQGRGLIILIHKTVKCKIVTFNTNQEAIAVATGVFEQNIHQLQHISTSSWRHDCEKSTLVDKRM